MSVSLQPYSARASFPAAGATSGTVDTGPYRIAGLFVPADFDGTQLTVEASADGAGTWLPVYTDDEEPVPVIIPVAAGRGTGVDRFASALAAFRYLRFISDAPQDAARAVTVVLK